MRRVFVDAVHYIALLIPNDDTRLVAIAAERDLVAVPRVTTEAVIFEVLAYVAKRGSQARREAIGLVDDLRSDPNTEFAIQTPELFDAALDLYRHRPDKGYSLTDCMSMVVCAEYDITDVLTYDHHFEQEGLVALLR